MSILIVTPEQYREGYREKAGDYYLVHSFRYLGKTDDGNYIVRTPDPQAKPLFADASRQS